MDGDGDLDAVVANAFDDSVSVFPGLGDGTFGERRDVAVGDEPRAVVVGDFDDDGDIDAATINTMSDDASILLNDGAGDLVLSQSGVSGENLSQRLQHCLRLDIPRRAVYVLPEVVGKDDSDHGTAPLFHGLYERIGFRYGLAHILDEQLDIAFDGAELRLQRGDGPGVQVVFQVQHIVLQRSQHRRHA